MTARAHSIAIGHDLINRPTQLSLSTGLMSLVGGVMAGRAPGERGRPGERDHIAAGRSDQGVIADDAHFRRVLDGEPERPSPNVTGTIAH